MNMNVYNLVWADDDIDALKDRYEKRFEKNGFNIIGVAHNGDELELCLSDKGSMVDAVIIDANFNESETVIDDERDTSGLSFTRSHLLKQYSSLPFILFTQRSDEMIAEKYRNTPKFFQEFPRHKRWFKKNDDEELIELFESIKEEVDKRNSSSFIIRNKNHDELNAATLINGGEEFVYEFLIREYEGTLVEMVEPFVRMRRIIEKMFALCETMNIIPPISSDTNGTARYFLNNLYGYKDKANVFILQYKMKSIIMAKPLAQSLDYVVRVTQDGSHSKIGLKLDIDKYFQETKDCLLLRSVATLFIDLLKWFALFMLCHTDIDKNVELWEKV